MKLTQIRDLVATLESGSIRGAARQLGVSQPAVTKSIRQLEADLGAALIVRTSQGTEPTEAGRLLLARARIVQSELAKVRADIAALKGDQDARLAVGVGLVPATMLILPTLAGYRRLRPLTVVRLVEGTGTTLIPSVRDSTLDLAVTQRVQPANAPGLKFKTLTRVRLILAARRGHPMLKAQSLRELAGASWAIYRPPGTGGVLEQMFAADGLPHPQDYVHCESGLLMVSLLATSDLIGVLAPPVVNHPFVRALIAPFSIASEVPPIEIGVYTRADGPPSPAAAAFIRALASTAHRPERSG